jgi:hypothetical protein
MRIAVVSTQNNGKTTLVDVFKKMWPMYKSPEKTYRDIIKEKNVPVNEQGTLEGQKIIQDALAEQALLTSTEKYSISDRIILDNLVYSLWLADKGKLGNDTVTGDFITKSILLTRETLKFYDVIFYLPLNPNIVIEDINDQRLVKRSIDPSYRIEIDELFQSCYEMYKTGNGVVFPTTDCPAVIELTGDLDDKIKTIKEYINDNGDLFETEKSVLSEADDMLASLTNDDLKRILTDISQMPRKDLRKLIKKTKKSMGIK